MTGADTDIDQAIIKCAYKIERFQQSGEIIGFEDARKKIHAWVENFRTHLDDVTLLARVIDNITFFPDEDVLHTCLKYQKDHIDLSEHQIFYTCLGAETESSSRIMRQLNNHHHYAPNIELLLHKIGGSHAENPAIVFIDDFLNSGGQLSAILKTWCITGNDEPDVNADSREFSQRRFIGESNLALFKSCTLHFIYLNGMAKGIENAKNKLKELGLIGTAYILSTYSDENGFFGTPDDICHIRNRIDVPVGQTSIFSGMSCDRITPLLELCEKAGRALLQVNKPSWPPSRIDARILGYGNSAKLFISQTNVPTCTLTCLWQGGRIEIDGKPFDWVPLIARTEKQIGQTENTADKTIRPGMIHHGISQSIGISDLSSVLLDHSPGAGPPLDITVFTTTPDPLPCLSPDLWKEAGMSYTDYLQPDIAEYLGLTAGSSRIQVKEMKAECYADLNRSVLFHMNDTTIFGRIKTIHITTFGTLISFLGIRFQFKTPAISLINALEINYHLPINKRINSKNFMLKVNGASLASLFKWGFAIAATGRKTDFLPEPDTKFNDCFEQRFRAFTFVREGSGIFETDKRLAESAFHLLANFSKPEEIFLQKASEYRSISLDFSAVISQSDKGATVFCAGNANQNKSYLNDHFQKRYYFLYLLVLHLQALKRKISLQQPENHQQIPEAAAWVQHFRSFPFDSACQKEYMNQFLDTLAGEMGLLKSTFFQAFS